MEQRNSGLYVPGQERQQPQQGAGKEGVNPLGIPKNPYRSEDSPGAIDVYPSEQNELMILMGAVMKKYEAEYATEEVQARMSNEIQGRVREQLGLLCSIEWLPTDINMIDGEYRATLTPTVTVTGRVDNTEMDHERISHEVQDGELDGVRGKITADGQFKTD